MTKLKCHLSWVVTTICYCQDGVIPGTQPEQRLGANDLLKVSVFNAPELSGEVRVGPDGQLRLPLLKSPVDARDKMPEQIEKMVSEALKGEELFVNPLVRVTVVAYQSRTVTVSGAVRRPTTFQAIGEVTLLDALAKAEGLSPAAGSEVVVTRQRASESEPASVRVPIRELFDGLDPLLNLRLAGGEQVRVLEGGKVFVVGNVKKQGAFLLGSAPGLTILQALAEAEGLGPYSKDTAYVYRNEPGRTGPQELAVSLKRVLQGEERSVHLQANDILYVPDNKGKRLTAQAVDRILGFGTSTLSGVLIWRTVR